MKRTVLFLLLTLTAGCAFAQVDTLWWRQREPTFYYWGTHYADCHAATHTVKTVSYASIIRARRCIADSTLKVIGIAAPASKYAESWMTPRDSSDANREPEYFQLYEATADSFYLVAEARYDTTHPRYRMELPNVWHGSGQPGDPTYSEFEEVPQVYEVYFDKPYLVSDSFYVAVTCNNNDFRLDESTGRYVSGWHYSTLYYEILGITDSTSDFYKIRYTNPFDRIPENQLTAIQQGFRDEYLRGWIYQDPLVPGCGYHRGYMPIFPIFDTTGLDIHGFQWVGECDTVRNLQLLDINDGVAYLSWNAGQYARWWEVSYGPVGTRPEDGMRDTVQHSFVLIEGLQQDSEYVVYVRERCREDTRGVWSTPLVFRMPHASDVKATQKTDVDIHTHLIPNPASGPVTVISGFRIEAIEVYTVAGALVSTQQVKANSTMLDVRTLPAGTYILRIRTSHGDTAKKLTVIKN